MPRRQFRLNDDDNEYLDHAFPDWESLTNGNWILLHNFHIPKGFTVRSATVAIQIPTNYPSDAPDMAYFYPAIARCDGVAIRATEATQIIDGQVFQRWSRHYQQGTWHSDEDNLAVHVMAINDWLDRALPCEVPA